MTLQELKDTTARQAYGMTTAEAHEKGICINCGGLPTWYSEAGRIEYNISGLCEPCYDRIFAEEDE